MLFNSLEFFLFFHIVTLLYFITPYSYRWLILLIASCIFYMFFIPIYILILLLTIVIDYYAGIFIEESEGIKKRKFLVISIVATCLVLIVFKYFNFFNTNILAIANFFNLKYPIPMLNIILPIGLSFHTFQSLSYVIEVYKGKQKAERHFGIYSLYVMFYPQLVAGPIETPQRLIPQFYEKHNFNYQGATDGLKLMAWGMFKKAVIADRLAIPVNHVYSNLSEYSGLTLILVTILFTFQIYCDFSGYSDIAIGSAQVMGFRLMKNFDRPFFSKTILELWQRWHISLGKWLKNYIYIPLGGNKVSKWRWQLNLFLTFVLSGLWHGSNWTYIIWGSLMGFYTLFFIWTQNIRNKVNLFLGFNKYPKTHDSLKILITFSLFVSTGIFFRSQNIEQAFYIISRLFIWKDIISIQSLKQSLNIGFGKKDLFFIFVLLFVESKQGNISIKSLISNKPLWYRWSLYYAIVMLIIFFGVFTHDEFIYFQF